MQRILAIGADPSLLHTRGLVLEKSGASVTIADPKQALHLLEGSHFDMLVLCHSLVGRDVQQLCVASCGGSPTKIILIEAPGALYRAPIDVDLRFQLEDGPALLVKTVRLLLASMNTDPTIDCATQPIPFVPSRRIAARTRKAAKSGHLQLHSKLRLIALNDGPK